MDSVDLAATRLSEVRSKGTRALDAEAFRSNLEKNSRCYSAGHQLAFEGDNGAPVLWVLKGWLALSKSLSDGQTQIIDFILPRDIALPGAADGLTAAFQVEALTDVEVASLSQHEWDRIKQACPDVQGLAVNLAAAAQARMSERMLRLGKGSAPMRIAYALLELSVRLKSIGEMEGDFIHLPLTQQQLGDFTGLSSVHVCRTLRRLVRNGVITTVDHRDIRIRDIAALSEMAGIDVGRLAHEISPVAA
ncbi:Crp/Fnr family transcriptional regulator [Ostreiculturibacter nitratireducens]|uniref:Crp/Fnr family transcriptional regulator n=1 Tax=Ostreiculturibacter nitratireducens TaxID=3075226 RepID=UPI0031B5AA4E